MFRYIFIDNNSRHIFGDTADFAAGQEIDSITDAARLLDESIGEHGHSYQEHDHVKAKADASTSTTGYHVYLAEVCGCEAVPVIKDGQDPEMVEAVESGCEYAGFVERIRKGAE